MPDQSQLVKKSCGSGTRILMEIPIFLGLSATYLRIFKVLTPLYRMIMSDVSLVNCFSSTPICDHFPYRAHRYLYFVCGSPNFENSVWVNQGPRNSFPHNLFLTDSDVWSGRFMWRISRFVRKLFSSDFHPHISVSFLRWFPTELLFVRNIMFRIDCKRLLSRMPFVTLETQSE